MGARQAPLSEYGGLQQDSFRNVITNADSKDLRKEIARTWRPFNRDSLNGSIISLLIALINRVITGIEAGTDFGQLDLIFCIHLFHRRPV